MAGKSFQLRCVVRDLPSLAVACGIAHLPLKTTSFDERTGDYSFDLDHRITLRGNVRKGHVCVDGPRYDGSTHALTVVESLTQAYTYLEDQSGGAI